MSEIEALGIAVPQASPPTSTPWVPLWPLSPSAAGELAYAEQPSAVSVTATTEGAAVTIVTAPAVACDGQTPVLVEFSSVGVYTPVAVGSNVSLGLFMDGVSQGILATIVNPGSSNDQVPVRVARRLIPSAGSHVFSIRAWGSATGGGVGAGIGGPGTQLPAAVRVSLASPMSLVAGLGAVTYGTTMPANPVDGQEHVLVDSTTNPSYQWRFRYNAGSSSSFKWEFVGGSPVVRRIATQENTASGTNVDLATPGPLFVMPRAGDFQVEWGFMGVVVAANPTNLVSQMYVNGVGSGISAVCNLVAITTAGVADTGMTAWNGSVAANDEWRMKYSSAAVINVGFANRWMRVTPVRVA